MRVENHTLRTQLRQLAAAGGDAAWQALVSELERMRAETHRLRAAAAAAATAAAAAKASSSSMEAGGGGGGGGGGAQQPAGPLGADGSAAVRRAVKEWTLSTGMELETRAQRAEARAVGGPCRRLPCGAAGRCEPTSLCAARAGAALAALAAGWAAACHV
jgi:hypothetical protein